MGLRTIYRMSSEDKSPPFCRCVNRRSTIISSSRKPFKPCECGEFDCKRIDWTWSLNAGDSANVQISGKGTNVLFHPVYSQGTAVVRSGTPLCANHIHYWEVKITSCMSGTDTVSIFVIIPKITWIQLEERWKNTFVEFAQRLPFIYYLFIQSWSISSKNIYTMISECETNIYRIVYRS